MKRWLLCTVVLGGSAVNGFGGQSPAAPAEGFVPAPGGDGTRCLAAAEAGDEAWATYCAGLSPASRTAGCARVKSDDPATRQAWCSAEWRDHAPSGMGPWMETVGPVEPNSPQGCDVENPPPCCYSPIVIDVRGNGFDLTSPTDGVVFDLRGDGKPVRAAWTKGRVDDTSPLPDDVWLALDRNENGLIDSGLELFGNFTDQPGTAGRNGYIALALFDKADEGGNGDSQISAADLVFNRLRLWDDRNHDGISRPEELFTLRALGVTALSLHYEISRITDEHGNGFRYRARVARAPGSRVGPYSYDVFLKVENADVPGAAACAPPPSCDCTDSLVRQAGVGTCTPSRRWRCDMDFSGNPNDVTIYLCRQTLVAAVEKCRDTCNDRAAAGQCR